MLVKTFLTICGLFVWVQAINGLRCYVCNDAKSEEECNWNTETCAINQGACFTEIRNLGKEIRLKKSCYQKHACNNLLQQSDHECPRVCTLCCHGDLCNIKPPRACACGLTTRAPRISRTQPSARPKPPRTSRKPTPRTQPRITSKAFRQPTTLKSTTTTTTTATPATTKTDTIKITTTHMLTQTGVAESKFRNASLTSAVTHSSVSMKISTESNSTSTLTINLLEANRATPGSAESKSFNLSTDRTRSTPTKSIPDSTLLMSSPKIQISRTEAVFNLPSRPNTTLPESTNGVRTTAKPASDIKLGTQNTTASTMSSTPTPCERMTFVSMSRTNTKVISCRHKTDSDMLCGSNFGIRQSEVFHLFSYHGSTNITIYHQCQAQPTNSSVSMSYDRSIPILCITMSNESTVREFRRQKSLMSLNHGSQNAMPNAECRLIHFNQNRQLVKSRNKTADLDVNTFKFDAVKRMQGFCGKRLFGVECSAALKYATPTMETTQGVEVASGNPSWMIPVIIVAVIVALILGIVVVLALLRKTGFYRVRKKVKPGEKDKK